MSAKLLKEGGGQWGGVLDLKTHWRGMKYAREIIKILQEKPEIIKIKEVFQEVTEKIGQIGRIHQTKTDISTT